jgi:hypothetical protein
MNILTAIHRLAESGAGRIKTLQDKRSEKRLRVGDYRVRFTEEHPETPPHPHGQESQGRLRQH